MFELFKKNDDFIPSNIDVNINDNDYLRFRNIQEADDWGKDFYGKYGERYKYIVKQLSEHDKKENSYKISADSLGGYCGYEYIQINSMMRGITNESLDYNIKINNILTTLYRSPVIKEKMILYRVVSRDVADKIIEKEKENSAFAENAFMSTALSYDGINDIEEPCLLKIYLNYYPDQNVHGLYVNEYTDKRSETELLLMPGLYIRMLDKPYWDESFKKWVYKVTVFPMRIL